MLKGLEINEVLLQEVLFNKDRRIDTQFWTEKIYYNPKLNYERIGNCLENAQYGISISMNEEEKGYPIYRMNEIHNMLCDLEVSKSADIDLNELKTFKLNNKDVLFNRTNSFEWVGRTGIYYKNELDNRDYVFASYLVRFIPNQKIILPEYLTTFLNTKYGIIDIKRRARQSINQTNVNPEEVKEIKIPLLRLELQKSISNNFEKAHKSLIISQQKYAEAETLLLETLGLQDFEPSTEAVNVKFFKSSFISTGRLDAEYYQPKYDSIEAKFNEFKRIRLGNLVEYPISSGVTPKAGGDDYTDAFDGIPFIRAVDLQNGQVNPNNFNYIKSPIHDNLLKRTKLKQNDVLFSIAGTVGRTAIFQHKFEANINQAVAILRFEETLVNRMYLVAFFNSKIGKLFVSKYSRQGLQTNLNLNEVADLSIPIIEKEIQEKIASLIKESFAVKAKGEQLLEVAKRAVEIAIEENEKNAMTFINQNS
ncbi:restriction endonuclease subunit S [Flavobacterium daemonense]|uniref:restriction endonuclease subunit S n=1 Tax=Flavobacterium daemonense TaxID=1393049 RepID=UPI0013A60F4D|nr:restriction endonuclease subunit S [Flavobacterium daemonense]KAF2336156.1 restriction endonuclease subunit S [Flavobacterium daemonense]